MKSLQKPADTKQMHKQFILQIFLVLILAGVTYFVSTKFQSDNASSVVSEINRDCEYGYSPIYTDSEELLSCEKIVVPDNAKLNVEGTDWECLDGYEMQYAHGYTRWCRLQE